VSDGGAQRAREVLEAWNRGDIDAVVAGFHPDCEIRTALLLGSLPFRGHEGVRAWLAEINETFGRFRIEIDEVSSEGDRALALCRLDVEGQSSGAPLTQPVGYVADFEQGLVKVLTTFLDHDTARAAAGKPR
jgi:ketosteroid isomerase-like protein